MVIDFATYLAPEGKVRDYLQKESPFLSDGSSIPRPAATNPKFLRPPGALLPLGGQVRYKGFGKFMIDLWRARCPEPEFAGRSAGTQDGWLMIALVQRFVPLDVFHAGRAACRACESCPAAPDSRICVPAKSKDAGALAASEGIEIDDRT